MKIVIFKILCLCWSGVKCFFIILLLGNVVCMILWIFLFFKVLLIDVLICDFLLLFFNKDSILNFILIFILKYVFIWFLWKILKVR